MSMKASVSSSSNSLKHGVCPATISQKMQSGSDFIYLLSVRNRLIANSQAAHSDPSEGTSFTRSYCLSCSVNRDADRPSQQAHRTRAAFEQPHLHGQGAPMIM